MNSVRSLCMLTSCRCPPLSLLIFPILHLQINLSLFSLPVALFRCDLLICCKFPIILSSPTPFFQCSPLHLQLSWRKRHHLILSRLFSFGRSLQLGVLPVLPSFLLLDLCFIARCYSQYAYLYILEHISLNRFLARLTVGNHHRRTSKSE